MPREIVQRASYDLAVVREKVFAILDRLGAGERIGSNTRVLIKPNLLAPAAPERAVLTHPTEVGRWLRKALEYRRAAV
jgi:uncharacterized protein (DUF362 family)